ncbi:MAG: gliding motility-associated C-terminal domain-containing protein [Chitinophagales bacterium]
MKHVYLLRFALLLPLLNICISGTAATHALNNLFFDNRGQVSTPENQPVTNVLCYAQTDGMGLYITSTGYSIVTRCNENNGTRYNRVDFTFANMHLQKEQVIFTAGDFPSLNFYNGDLKIEAIKTSDRILIRNVYPGIDWVWRFDASGKPKHEFAVNYGADASQIKYTVTGADALQKENYLEYGNQYLRIKEGPVTLQQLNDDYTDALLVQGNSISYKIPEKLKEGGYTIDPPLELIWSHGIDTLKTTFRRIVKDSIYRTISTGFSADYNLPAFPQLSGSYVSATRVNRDVVIMKTDYRQNLIWCTFFGGANNDEGNSITTTPDGLFITGYSESWNFPISTAGNYTQLVSLNGRDAFIAKFDNEGRWKWSTGYGGIGLEEGMDIKYLNGKVYVAGYTSSDNFPVLTKAGAYNKTAPLTANYDGFLLEFDTACYRQWGTCFGSSGDDYFSALYVDVTGIYTTGFSSAADTANIPLLPLAGAYYQPTHQKREVILQKFNLNDTLEWSTYFGAEESDIAASIKRNEHGLFICGKTNSADLPVQDQLNGNYFQDINNGGYDGFVARFDPVTLQKKYCTYYGTGGDDGLSDLSYDDLDNTVFTGYTNSTVPVVNYLSEYFHQDVSAGGYDGIVLGFDTLQRLHWATNFGTDGNDWGHGVLCILPCITDVVGEGLYNYGQERIGGTYLSSGCSGYLCTKFSSNGVSNRFLNQSCVLTGGNFPGTGGNLCPYYLNFQALIPLKNTCPDQCNGKAMIDTSNIGGCPPYQINWSNGDSGLGDSALCENYWSEVQDAAGQSRKIYGRFNVLRVSSPPNVYTTCEDTADWKQYIHIEGGGPPYILEFRGTSNNDCPTTAFFAIYDTAGCVVSHSMQWFRQNRGIHGYFNMQQACQLWISADLYSGQCINLSNSATWNYIIISGEDTVRKPFVNTTQGVFALQPEIGKKYYGYLDMGDCISFLDSFLLFDSIRYQVQYTRACHANDGGMTITVAADSALLQQSLYYTLLVEAYDSINQNYYQQTIFYNSPQPGFASFSNLPPSVYHLNLHHGSCDSTRIRIDLRSFTYDVNQPEIYCNHPDSLITTLTFGTPPLTYEWQATLLDTSIYELGIGLSTIVIDRPGTYYLTISDTNNCQKTDVLEIDGSYKVHIDSVQENIYPCNGMDNATSAAVYFSQGNAPYNYLWSSGEQGFMAGNIVDSIGWVIVTDRDNCRDSMSFINTKKPEMVITDSITDSRCFNTNDGAISLLITEGYAPYYVQWSDGYIDAERTYLAEGAYLYTVTDDRGCIAQGSAIVHAPDSIVVTYTTTAAHCIGSDGGATVTANGGTGFLSIYWQDGSVDFNRSDLPAGSNSFAVVDQNGCQVDVFINIDTINNLAVSITKQDITCFGTNDGSLTATATGGQGTVNYAWSSGDFGYTIPNAPAGFYEVTATDNTGCSATDTASIWDPEELNFTVDTNGGLFCHDDNAYITFYPYGGTPPYYNAGYTYLPAGDNVWTITDDHGCTATQNISLSNPEPLEFTAYVFRQPDCNNPDGVITAIASGGRTDYALYLDNNFQGYFNDSLQINASPGPHDLEIWDNHDYGCYAYVHVDVDTTGGTNGYAVTHNPTCQGLSNGSIQLVMTGGIPPFEVNGNYFASSYTYNNLPQGSYTYTVYDAAGCQHTFTQTLTQPSTLTAAIDTGLGIPCGGTQINVHITAAGGTPPYTGDGYLLQGAGPYNMAVSDSNNCVVQLNYTLSEPTPLVSTLSLVAQPSCITPYGAVHINTTGGHPPYNSGFAVYPLYTDSITIGGLQAGNQQIIVTDSTGCIWDGNMYINTYELLQLHLTNHNPECHAISSGSVTVDIDHGTSPFSLNGATFISTYTISNLDSGSYTYTITDSAGCPQTIQFSLDDPSPVVAAYNITEPIHCTGDQATIAFTASGGTPPYQGLGTFTYGAGFHQYTLMDSLGCTAQVSFNLTNPAPFSIDTDATQPTCTNPKGTLTLLPSGGQSPYYVQTNNGTLSFNSTATLDLAPGIYNIAVRDTLGCVVNTSVNMQQPAQVFATAQATDLSCYQNHTGVITINVQDGEAPFTINNVQFTGSTSFNNLNAGTYTYLITDAKGCTKTVTATVNQPLPLIIDSVHLAALISCSQTNDAAIEIFAEGGNIPYTYGINGPVSSTQQSSYFNNLSAGTYTASIVDNKGCSAVTGFEVPAFEPRTFDVQVDTVTCHGGTNGAIRIYPHPPDANQFMFSINGGPPQVYNVFYDLSAGSYAILITDNHNCQYNVQANVSEPDSFDARVWLNGDLLPQDSTLLDERQYADFVKVSTHPWEVSFSPTQSVLINSDTLVEIQPRETITYSVVVYKDSADHDCYVAYKGVIAVHPIAAIPNLVTPNGDGFNDRWEIDLDKFPNAVVTIFDRWGEIVFESQNYANDWAGTFKNTGRKVADGTYFYIMKVPSQGNKVYKGDINILNSTN